MSLGWWVALAAYAGLVLSFWWPSFTLLAFAAVTVIVFKEIND